MLLGIAIPNILYFMILLEMIGQRLDWMEGHCFGLLWNPPGIQMVDPNTDIAIKFK